MDLSTLCFEHSPVCVGVEPQLAPYLPGIWLLEVAGERYQGVVKVKVGPVTVVIFSMSVSVAHVSARVSGTSNFVLQVHLLTSLATRINRSCFAWYST